MIAFYWMLVVAYQWGIGAFNAAFGGYPDEPAHFLSGLMIHDYLRSGMAQRPLEYASNYYIHLPYFAVGYWPPLFYITEALWMLLFGAHRAAVMLLIALIAAYIAFSIVKVARRSLNGPAALLIGLLFLEFPVVLWSNALVMTDTAVAALAFAGILMWGRYLDLERSRDALWFALFASMAVLTKLNALFLVVVPFTTLVLTRRWRLLRGWAFWLSPAVVLLAAGLWLSLTRRYTGLGFIGIKPPGATEGVRLIAEALWNQFWALTPFVLIGVWQMVRRLASSGDAAVHLSLPLAVIALVYAAPVDKEARYLMTCFPSLLVIAASGMAWLANTMSRGWFLPNRLAIAFSGAAVVLVGSSAFQGLRPMRNEVRPVADFVLESKRFGEASIFVPSQMEGSFIAEIAMRDHNRPSRVVCRPNKIFAEMNWQGGGYQSRVATPQDVLTMFAKVPIDLTILSRDSRSRWSHVDVVAQTIRSTPGVWERVDPGSSSPFEVYRYLESHDYTDQQMLSAVAKLLLSRTLQAPAGANH